MKLFLDTNVLLDYLLDSRGAFHGPAVQLMRQVATGEVEAGFATYQAADLYYCLREAAGNETARSSLRGLYSLCELYPTSAEACVDALELSVEDYEDAVHIETARRHACDYIITRNTRDFEDSSVPFIDPAGFVALREGVLR